jgi:hypothetical protein
VIEVSNTMRFESERKRELHTLLVLAAPCAPALACVSKERDACCRPRNNSLTIEQVCSCNCKQTWSILEDRFKRDVASEASLRNGLHVTRD